MTENLSTVENAKEKLDLWIKQGLTVAGGKLPSERELGELLGIKRMTLRQALLGLEAESRIQMQAVSLLRRQQKQKAQSRQEAILKGIQNRLKQMQGRRRRRIHI